jgi:hypothetical protein
MFKIACFCGSVNKYLHQTIINNGFKYNTRPEPQKTANLFYKNDRL